MRMRFANQTVIVSGGATGCGAAAVRMFAAEGARVAIVDRNSDAGELLCCDLRESGQYAIFAVADVSQSEDVARAVTHIVRELGPATVLFNHAGAAIVKPFLDISESEWDGLMATNVKSMYLMTKAVLPGMLLAGEGSIVCTSSSSAVAATPNEVLYDTTKGACHMFARSIAVEFRDRNIRCNAICPGLVRTPHGERERADLISLGVDVSDAALAASQGRYCEPDEVARVVCFLASAEASFVNGAHVFVDNCHTAK